MKKKKHTHRQIYFDLIVSFYLKIATINYDLILLIGTNVLFCRTKSVRIEFVNLLTNGFNSMKNLQSYTLLNYTFE